jgi:molybdopterin/thiamine biosynthesis adenylyltransferase
MDDLLHVPLEQDLIHHGRLDRQLRIDGWNQPALEAATIGVVGDNDLLASLFLLSAAALGINHVVVIAPVVDEVLVKVAKRVNSNFALTHIEGFYTHPILDEWFKGCGLIVDLSHFGLANKLCLEKGFNERIPIVRGFCYKDRGVQGFVVFTYVRGREWLELERIVCANSFPGLHFDDGVFDTITAGIALEEVKNILMSKQISDTLITYARKTEEHSHRSKILVVGSGALGAFVGLGLAYSGFKHCTFLDPDRIELTNLNRQVLFYDAFGQSKAVTLASRLRDFFGMDAVARIAHFEEDTDISPYDVVFDCVDNFESRIVLSEACRNQRKPLISGGTSADAGQVVVYDPTKNTGTPAELLGLYSIVGNRTKGRPVREKTSCTYQPDPSVIMTNQIIAGFMVDAYRALLGGQEVGNIFYDSTSSGRIQV